MDVRWIRNSTICAAATMLAAMTGTASAQTPLKVIVFPGMSNLAQFAAQSQGFFAKRGLAVELINTPNSTEQRNGLAEGRYHIAHSAADNAVAMVETAKADVALFMGGNNGMNSLFVQPEINSYDDLRGKTVVVDSPNTAFAILLYKMLAVKGLMKGDYAVKGVGATRQRLQAMTSDKAIAAGMLSPPLSLQAARAGFKDFGSAVAVVGPYQSDSGLVMRTWAQVNADTLVRYIQANVQGIRWAFEPTNRAAVVDLLADRLKQPKEAATEMFKHALDQRAYAVDAAFDLDGFRNVLKLRAEMLGTWGGTPPAPDKYLDFSYYRKALAGL
jgi:ABC-type nitrate/sulfonate/bicarbonate transport system substrate-binding protein